MDWVENEELTNDRCSTASSISNSGDANSVFTANSNGPKVMANQMQNGHSNNQSNGNASLNLDSMSDGEISDFSLNDTDDEEFRSNGNNGKICNTLSVSCSANCVDETNSSMALDLRFSSESKLIQRLT